MPQRLAPVRQAFDDAEIDLLIEALDLGAYGSHSLLLAHGFEKLLLDKMRSYCIDKYR
jgi:hypothetical protein